MHIVPKQIAVVMLSLLSIAPVCTQANTFTERADVQTFITSLSNKHKIDRTELTTLFNQITLNPEIIERMNSPAEAKPWHQYRPIFVTDSRSAEGVEFMQQHAAALKRAEEKYGVDASIITAIIGVESRYGQHKGKYKIINALATLGFDYPRRGKFFRKELEHFILLCKEEHIDPFTMTGSYAGAMGKPQFIPSSYREYAVDFDNDGVRNLLTSADDAIGSVASYLARHGWQRGLPVALSAHSDRFYESSKKPLKPKTTIAEWRKKGVKTQQSADEQLKTSLVSLKTPEGHEYWLGSRNFYAITRYNHSPLYAMAVFQLSERIKDKL